MMKKSAQFLLFILAIVSFVAIQDVRAQQQRPRQDSREDSARDLCRTPVTVTGAVISPGRFVLQRRVRLAEVLAAAGGLSGRAGKTVEIRRAGLNLDCDSLTPNALNQRAGSVEVYVLDDLLRDDGKADPEVHPGDHVIVSEIGVVYVYGSVAQPREILLKERTTVTQVIKLVGGVAPGGVTNKVKIMRGCDPMQTIVVDLKAIERGRAADVLIQPYDIVFVPGKRVYVGTPLCLRLVPQPTALPSRIIH